MLWGWMFPKSGMIVQRGRRLFEIQIQEFFFGERLGYLSYGVSGHVNLDQVTKK